MLGDFAFALPEILIYFKECMRRADLGGMPASRWIGR
jgi:hypothetical protein